MQPRCAMRFESHTPKSLANAKTHLLDQKSQENAIKNTCENLAMLACDAKNQHVFETLRPWYKAEIPEIPLKSVGEGASGLLG